MAVKNPFTDSETSLLAGTVSSADIRDQMERIMNASEFNATEAQRNFLQFVVTKTLAGQSDEIKAYTVATEALGRHEDFNQATDPIVSMQANKLRRALERYYLLAGQNDSIRITIPKGTYIPAFDQCSTRAPVASLHLNQNPAPGSEAIWPSLCIQSFDNLTGDPELDILSLVIAAEMALEITRYQEIRVVINNPEIREGQVAGMRARFVLTGSILDDPLGYKVIISLTDLATGVHVWGDSHQVDVCPSQLIRCGGIIARAVAGKISSEQGIIANKLTMEVRNKPPSQLNTYEALLSYYQFKATYAADMFNDAATALWRACQDEPDCGLIWSMLARLHAINYFTELVEAEFSINDALEFAQTSVRLDPANQRTRAVLAFILMLKNELPAAMAEAERALALSPHSVILLDNIGLLLTWLGDWQRGPALIRKAMAVNPHYNTLVHYALWAEQFRQGAYEAAHREMLRTRTPNLFWDPAVRAATLGLLGRIGEGRQAAAELIALKPHFAQRGLLLIRRFLKSDKVLERMVDGLDRVGIHLQDS